MQPENEQYTPPIPPTPPTPVSEPRRYRRPHIVGPVILILLGLSFLVNNLGIWQFNVWELMWRLWPVWLIAAGLDLMIGRRTSWGSWVVLGLVVTVIGGSVWWFGSGWAYNGTDLSSSTISESLHDATSADVHIKPGVGELRIAAGSADKLVEGTVYKLPGEFIDSNSSGSSGHVSYTLNSRGVNVFPGVNFHGREGTWNLRLNPQVPTDLEVNTGVGKATVDLSGMNLTNLTVNTGIGEATITLPAQGKLNAQIKSGIGKVTIEVPQGMAVRVRAQHGIGNVSVLGQFNREGGYFVTPGFDGATNRMEIEVEGGIGEIQLRQL
jgi:hypothetical protein